MTLCQSVLNFLLNNNMVQTKKFIFTFLKNDITLFSSQFSVKRQHGSNQEVDLQIFSKMK